MVDNEPELWRAKVRSCRIIDPSAGPNQPGVSCNKSRAASVVKALATLTQTVRVREIGGVMWMSKPEFIHHHISTQGITPDAAASKWDEMLSDDSVSKTQVAGEEPRIAVRQMPRTEVVRERSFSKSIEVSGSIESQTQADAAVGQLAKVGAGPACISSPMFSDMASVFRPGAAAGSSSGQPLVLNATAAPPTAAIVPPSAFEGSVARVKRVLTPTPSNPDPDGQDDSAASKSKQPRCSALQGIAGDLLECRQRGIQMSKAIWDVFGKSGKNIAKAVSKSIGQSESDLAPQEQAILDRYEAHLLQAKALGASVKTWTLENAADNVNTLVGITHDLDDMRGQLTELLEMLRARALERRKAQASSRNELCKARSRVTSVYKGSVSDVVLRYLYEAGAFRDQVGTVSEGSVGPLAQGPWVDRCNVVVSGEASFKPGDPALFPPATADAAIADVLRRVQSIAASLGQQRLATAVQQLKTVMADKNWPKARNTVEPKGQPTDTLEALDWIPEDWAASRMVPEALRGLGVPRVLVSKSGEATMTNKEWPMCGLGQFLLPLSGSITLMCWPVSSLLSLGVSVSGQLDFINRAMPYKSFSVWADNKARFVRLVPGSAFWMPYGWYGLMLSRPADDNHVSVLTQPYVTKVLAHACPDWPAVSADLQAIVAQMVKENTPWYVKHGSTVVEWLKAEVSGATAASASGQPKAICNGDTDSQKVDPSDLT